MRTMRLTPVIKRQRFKITLIGVVLLASALRLYGINWDGEFFLHPDERWILMVVSKLKWPSSWESLLSVNSPLNPHFFAYGSLPLYLLKIGQSVAVKFFASARSLGELKILGRTLSVSFDLVTLFVVYRLGRQGWGEKTGLLAALLYATTVFPIQNSHFYTVDIQLAFWCILAWFLMAELLGRLSWKTAVVLGVVLGVAGATKISAAFLLFPLGACFLLLLIDRSFRRISEILFIVTIVLVITVGTFFLLQPYVLIDFAQFRADVLRQAHMSRDALVFPYTIQYVDTAPYGYHLKNLILWGLGLPLGILALAGLVVEATWCVTQIYSATKKRDKFQFGHVHSNLGYRLLMFSWIIPYFLVTGSFAVKFMRYLLPLYPFLVLMASCFVTSWKTRTRLRRLLFIGKWILVVVHFLYALAFSRIYSIPHTRITASEWITQNIPVGSTVAVEHWDDALPLYGQEKFDLLTLELYDTDRASKVVEVEEILERADYIIVSSPRLWKSIPRLPERYSWATAYYNQLFAGTLGFDKVAEFTSYPRIEMGKFTREFNDDGADESFTVYDHPKVMIFKRRG